MSEAQISYYSLSEAEGRNGSHGWTTKDDLGFVNPSLQHPGTLITSPLRTDSASVLCAPEHIPAGGQ